LLNIAPSEQYTESSESVEKCNCVAVVQGGHKPGKPGVLRDFSEYGKLREFCATSEKIFNKQSIFSSSFKYLCKTAVDRVNRIIRISGSSDPAQ